MKKHIITSAPKGYGGVPPTCALTGGSWDGVPIQPIHIKSFQKWEKKWEIMVMRKLLVQGNDNQENMKKANKC